MSRSVTALGNGRYLVEDGSRRRLAHAAVEGARVWVFLDGRVSLLEEVSPVPSRERSPDYGDAQALSAPMPATVAAIAVEPGDRVARGDVLVTLEAMKMELPITAPRDGVVKTVACREGELVQAGVPLLELE